MNTCSFGIFQNVAQALSACRTEIRLDACASAWCKSAIGLDMLLHAVTGHPEPKLSDCRRDVER
jgi:hypothetical protein